MESGVTFDQDTPPEPMPTPDAGAGNVNPARPVFASQEEEIKHIANTEEKLDAEVDDSPPAEDILDTLVPRKEPRTWTVGKGEYERQYLQRPLSFIGKMEWFALVGKVLDEAMSGDDALTVNNLLSGPGTRSPGELSMADFRDADTFIQAVGKLISKAPDFLLRSYCIWLAVPDYDREVAIRLMSLPAEDGGLSDSDGIEIIEVFIDQNYEALDSFFRQEVSRVQKRVQKRAAEAADSRSSKR